MNLISAILLILAYPRFNLEFLVWIALVPLFFTLEDKKLSQRFIIGYLFGIIFFAGTLYWLINVTIPGTIVLVLLLALAPGIFCSLYATRHPLSAITFIPSLWVLTEYLRTHLFTGFPWALLGYSQSFNLPLIQIADITGVYGVSFLIVLVNLGIYMALKKVRQRFYILFFIFLLMILVLTYGQKSINRVYPTQNLKVSVIQGNIRQEMKWDPRYRKFIIDKYKAITDESLKENPRLVIWPETSVPGYLEEERDLRNHITNLAAANNIHLLVGTLRKKGSRVYNSATLISNTGEISDSYDKIHLVPFGEFVPFGNFFSWMRAFIDKPIGDFDSGKEFTVFKFRVQSVAREAGRIQKITEFHDFSALICFEDIFPDLCRRFVKNGARFLVNMTNDAWFGKTPAPYQHVHGSIFRAVENRVPVVRAANTGVSCIIDHKGKIVKLVTSGADEIFVDGYQAEVITPVFANTIYTRFGDMFSWICITLIFVHIGIHLRCQKEKL